VVRKLAIEKMSFINIVGNMNDLDHTLLKCLECNYFHPEASINSIDTSRGFKTLSEENPYTAPLNKITQLGAVLKTKLVKREFDLKNLDLDKVNSLIQTVESSVNALEIKKRELKESIYQHEQATIQINHLNGLNVSFEEIFACQFVKVRFGRLPTDSYTKLNYYSSKTFFFFPFDHDDDYYWGVYFAPFTSVEVIDEIFNSLYFERLRVPDYAHGTPDIAKANIKSMLDADKNELERVLKQIEEIKRENETKLKEYFCALKYAHTSFSLRKNVSVIHEHFYLVGFIPKDKITEFSSSFNMVGSVSCVAKPYDANPRITPPVKLKNNRFAKPFEAFMKMYSLPSYNDMDLTTLVAITYTILFGIMFGDLGQGLLIALIGFIISKKIPFGRILKRIGFSSAFFGTLYGSVFGYEHLLDPFYKKVFGLSSKPIHVFDTNTTNILLGGAVGIGVVLITISMVINIIQGLKTKNYERSIFGHNGVAGLVVYLSAAAGIGSMMLGGPKIMTAPYITFLIVLPLLVIFFRDPLTKLSKGQKKVMPHNIGEFVIENFFELFEYVLSYLSNSMSFLRVGGFILSHAGMMAVVMSLSEMAGSVASPIVMIIGNLFVMCLEGLIVGIQVLRLEFYEIFSRNFEGNGKPFEPAHVTFEVEK